MQMRIVNFKGLNLINSAAAGDECRLTKYHILHFAYTKVQLVFLSCPRKNVNSR